MSARGKRNSVGSTPISSGIRTKKILIEITINLFKLTKNLYIIETNFYLVNSTISESFVFR